MVVFSVVNRNYLALAEAWAQRVKAVSGCDAHFCCADRESYAHLQARGYECFDHSPEVEPASTSSRMFPRSSFPNDFASYTVSLKFKFALELMRRGTPCVYSDVDALWLRDPLTFLKPLSCSIAFQPGSFPTYAKQKWGFSACTGFVALHPSDALREFLSRVVARFAGGDQVAFNETMLQDCSIVWERQPANWEHCRTSDGWTAPLLGKCERSRLEFVALPHTFFQRHGTTREDCAHAIVCHPNSPKNQAGKIEVFRSLGLWAD